MGEATSKVTVILETSPGQDDVITNHLRELQRWGKPVPPGVLSDLLEMKLVEMPPAPDPTPSETGYRVVCMNCGLGWSPFDDKCPTCESTLTLDAQTGKTVRYE